MSGEPTFTCPQCQKRYRWKLELAGRRVRCKCGETMRVPEEAEAAHREAVGAGAAGGAGTSAGAAPGGQQCPSCGENLSGNAVLCVHCGYNLATGEAMGTSVGRAVKTAHGPRQVSSTRGREGFLARLQRSWEYVKISYGLLWDFKQLLVFPLFSMAAALLVLASFALPLWNTDVWANVETFLDEETAASEISPLTYVIAFAFYFCNYFVIVFFNTALAACALRVCAGETPTVGYGLSLAARRLPQIAGWALLSATVGLILKAIENANDKVGQIVAAILGTAWTALTYFVVPVLAAEGVGPIEAFKRALSTLKKTWGESLIGNFSMALITFVVALPVLFVLMLLLFLAFQTGDLTLIVTAALVLVGAIILIAVASSAADMVFRSLMYNYATGRTIPEEVDESLLEGAFGSRADE